MTVRSILFDQIKTLTLFRPARRIGCVLQANFCPAELYTLRVRLLYSLFGYQNFFLQQRPGH